MKKFSGIIAFTILTAVAITSASASAPWNGNADQTWYNATDTEFSLGTAEQLAGLAEIVNAGTDNFEGKTITLSDDINLNGTEHLWTPIGATMQYPFAGHIHGNGRTISGMVIVDTCRENSYFGFIACGLDASADFLTFTDSKITIIDTASLGVDHNLYVGTLIGYNSNGTAKEILIEGCTSECEIDVNSSNTSCVGGLVGASTNIRLNFIDCVNRGNISNNRSTEAPYYAYAAGIIGGTRLSNFTNCVNSGNIYCFGRSDSYSAGMNSKRLNTISDTTYVTNCSNTGNFESRSKKAASISAGLIASTTSTAPTSSYIEMSDCRNSGTMLAPAIYSKAYSAGLIGYCYSISMKRCGNTGCLVATSTPEVPELANMTSTVVGGLIAYSAFQKVEIENCYNTGDILAQSSSHDDIAGGLVGKVYDYRANPLLISSSYNTGKISSDSLEQISSILANYIFSKPELKQCYALENTITLDDGLTWQSKEEEIFTHETSDFMKSAEFVALLNQNQSPAWSLDAENSNRGYPVLLPPSTTAVEEVPTKQVAIYPNPSSEYIVLAEPVRNVKIYNALGACVLAIENTVDKIDISSLQNGVYILRANGSASAFAVRK